MSSYMTFNENGLAAIEKQILNCLKLAKKRKNCDMYFDVF